MQEKMLGKISSVHFGIGGYQDCQIGLTLSLECKSTGCTAFVDGGWSPSNIEWDKNCKWTEADRTISLASMMRKVDQLLHQAKVTDVYELKNKPVEVTFEGNILKNWRILEEVL